MDERAQSATLGTLLVISITVVAATATVGAAVFALDESRTQANEERASIAAAQFDSAAALVAFSDTNGATTVDIGNADRVSVVDSGTMWVNRTYEQSDGTNTTETLVDEQLGAVEYETDGDTLAYQGGGVWRQGDGYARMVSPPEFDFNENTLTLPVVSVSTTETPARFSGDSVRLSSNGSRTTFPSPDTGTNPVENSELEIKVESKYYRAWGRYFERRVGGDVTIDDTEETASVTLKTEYDNTITYGVASTAASGFDLKGGGGSRTFLDSYDSSTGDYATSQQEEDGRIVAGGNVNIRGKVTVYGDIVVPEGNHVDTNKNSHIKKGEILKEPISTQRPAGRVRQKITTVRESNDNADTALADNKLASDEFGSDDSVELTAGDYYIDGDLQLDDQTLTLDTSDGDITLAVTGNIDISNGGKIEVEGSSGVARVYTTGDRFDMNDGTVFVPGDDSTRFWLYGTDDLNGEMNSGSKFIGIYYAPGDDSSLNMHSESEIYGAMAVGEPDLKSGSTVHYDLAAEGLPAYDTDATLFSYLHVSRNEVVVEKS
ncbi:hypothetical protein BRD16_05405 [Halobacteriales archaeon SW_6_65_46]|nr:MAG: hypothetical protein BRD16_05405 [Halobacteriales archaeon SW_6_65_46]